MVGFDPLPQQLAEVLPFALAERVGGERLKERGPRVDPRADRQVDERTAGAVSEAMRTRPDPRFLDEPEYSTRRRRIGGGSG